jgi:colanic acid biosynthesis glycosyl transferase WcaI
VVRVPMTVRGRTRPGLVFNYFTFALSASLLGAWKLRGEKFDVIFVYEPSPVTVGLPAVLLRWLKKAPLAFWVLDLWPETLSAIGVVKKPWLLRLVGRLVSFIYNRCDLILAQSRSFSPSIARYSRHPERIAYFPSWAEDVFASGEVQRAIEVPPRTGADTLDIMFAGNIGEAQDFPAVLAAAEALKDHAGIRWLIVGDGRKAAWVRAEIQKRGLGERVRMLGRHPVERMPSFYRCADVMLVSLKDEPIFELTIPGKLQSYLAAGMPVLAMLNGEGADVVRAANAGFTCPAGDAQALARAVLAFAALAPAERAQMARNAAETSRAQFDRTTLLSQLEKWLLDLQSKGLSR